MSEEFYKKLPEAPNLTEALLPKWLRPLPDDWLVIKSDMVGSTRNILEGRYKEVNSSAGLLIIAAANALGNMNFPFFFGGDGVTLAIHHSKQSQLRPMLAGVIKEIKDIFGFDYRLAVFPVCDIYKAGFELKCSVVRISEKYRQAVLVGSGIDWMESELKNPQSPYLLDLRTEPIVQPDMRGFSCRWQDFPSPREETVALIVRPRHDSALNKVFQVLDTCIPSKVDAHPLRLHGQKMNFDSKNLRTEAITMSNQKSGLRYQLWLWIIKAQMLMLTAILKLGIRITAGKKRLDEIPKDNYFSSDTSKIEHNFYAVFALTRQERACLEEKLEALREQGLIFWGMHISNRAMLTCLIQLDIGQEVHFVDAADGGYAMASRQLKEQLVAAG